ncbi:hypothetical protein BDR06DRAFT_890770 [Suillus hirtellus]|nr:hypothetical protein BDR06DRAFT_890770 [Suillus hirtellus]
MALVANPILEVIPDFAGNAYAGIHVDLQAATNQTKEEVVTHLSDTWNADHNARIAEWNQDQEAEAKVLAEAERARITQEDAECAQHEAEAEREHLEAEKKKPKMNGFNEVSSVGDYLTPCPAQYAIQKLTNFEYIELWYFSPESCRDALKSLHLIAENDLSIMRTDDQLTLQPTSAFKALKAAIADHKLSFSIFL